MIEVVYATTSASVGNRTIHAGQHWPKEDPIVKQYPNFFSSDPRYGLVMSEPPKGWEDPPVEQVTAGPGERRSSVKRG